MAKTSRATHGESLCSPIELRESATGPMLHGVLIQEGRAASARAEVFAPLSLVWASEGVAIRAEHLGAEDSRAIPTREPNGEIRIAAPASPALVAAFNEGRRFLSIEFHSLKETRSAAGVREIQSAFLPGAALVAEPEYKQATAEVRQSGRGLGGRFSYNVPTVLRNRGRKRKQTVRPGAFRFAIQDETREINLLLGRDYDKPLASKQAGTLNLIDTPEGLEFAVDALPDTSYVRDFRAGLSSGAFVAGVAALYAIPPLAVVPGATELIPDPDNPDVDIEVVNQAVLTALAVVTRPPRGNPGEVSERAAEAALVAGKQRRRRVWL